MPESRRSALLANLVLAVAYALVGVVTLALGETGGVELRRVIWASSGVAVTAALLAPYALWWGAGIGGALATLVSGSGAVMVVGTGLANGLEVFLTVALLRRTAFDVRLERVRDTLLLIGLGSGVAALLAAMVSVLTLHLSGNLPPGGLPRITLMWWLTHAIGIVVIAPVALSLTRLRQTVVRRSPIEWLTVLLGVALSAWLPFSVPESALWSRLFFLPFPFLLWAAIRLGMGGAALGALMTTLCALVAAVRHTGPLAVGTSNATLTLTWLFVNVVMLATLISAALVAAMERSRLLHEAGEGRLRAVLDSASEGIVVTDGERHVTHVNRSIGVIWPATGEAPRMGQSVDQSFAPLVARVTSENGASLLLPSPTLRGRSGTATFTDGSVWDVQVQPLSDSGTSDGTAAHGAGRTGAVWSFRDMTARVRAEEERQELQAQLLHGQKLESLGVMAGGIAHDFNNLLMSIRARSELIADLDDLHPEAREDVEAVLRIVDQAAALCRQLLVYTGRGVVEERTIDLSAIARDIPELLRASVSRQVHLALDPSADRLWVSGDAMQLRQVALNLVTNASDAVEATGRGGTVWVSTRRAILGRESLAGATIGQDAAAGEYCIIEVVDDGVGMSDATMRKVFDPFFTSKGTGRGLGLSSVLGVVRRHRGALTVESVAGSGSRFVVALPAAPAPEATGEAAVTENDWSALKGHTVLVVDDDDEVRGAVARLLSRFGLVVREAGDGEVALTLLGETGGTEVSVVLLDLTMPRLSGPATLSAMRARGITTPVIIASGYSAESIPEAERGGPFVQKPYRGDELRRAIAEVLGGDKRVD